MDEHGIKTAEPTAVRKRKSVDVGEAHLSVAKVAARDPVTCDRQHFRADVDTYRVFHMTRQYLEHPACARSRIEEIFDRRAGDVLHDRRFDVLVRRMKGADAFPLRGVGLEIGRRFSRSRLTHLGETL